MAAGKSMPILISVLLRDVDLTPASRAKLDGVLNEEDIYREWAPPPAWRHAVACCWEKRVTADRVQRVVPDGHADLLMYESGAIEVVGLADEVALPTLPAGTWVQGVRIRPEAVAATFRVTASELTNRTIAGDDMFGARRARKLIDQRALDAWLTSVQPDDRTAAATRLLASLPVATAADELGITIRQLRRILVSNIGLAPKPYQRVVRFQRFLAAAECGQGLAAAAADAGYADQAHLTREVRALTAVTPALLLKERLGDRPSADTTATPTGRPGQ
jgi:AraC-like DNA-binding protein